MDLVTNVVTGSNADRLLLLLHGYGADERDLGGLLGYLDPNGSFAAVLPRGPVAAPPGFSWFDLASDDYARLACGRADPDEALVTGVVAIEGDVELGGALVRELNYMF